MNRMILSPKLITSLKMTVSFMMTTTTTLMRPQMIQNPWLCQSWPKHYGNEKQNGRLILTTNLILNLMKKICRILNTRILIQVQTMILRMMINRRKCLGKDLVNFVVRYFWLRAPAASPRNHFRHQTFLIFFAHFTMVLNHVISYQFIYESRRNFQLVKYFLGFLSIWNIF